MPIIEVKAFSQRFDDADQNAALVKALTDAMAAVYGDAVRPSTWVVLNGVPRTCWGIGGQLPG